MERVKTHSAVTKVGPVWRHQGGSYELFSPLSDQDWGGRKKEGRKTIKSKPESEPLN